MPSGWKERKWGGLIHWVPSLGGHLRKHTRGVKTPYLFGITERKRQLKQFVCLHDDVNLIQCGQKSYFSAVACKVIAL